jgi:hypothetical protein
LDNWWQPRLGWERILAQFGLEDFAGGVAGERGDKNDAFGDFVVGEFATEELVQGFFVEGDAVSRGHVGEGLFAFARIGDADDGGFFDAGELVDDFFDFARIDVDAVDEEHVFLAVGDVVVAVGVAMADVAGEQPIAAHGFGGFGGLIPVTHHHVAAAHADFAGFIGAEQFAVVVLNADFDVGDGQADGAGLAHAAKGVLGDDGAGFAQAVAFDDGDVMFGFKVFEDLHGQRGGAADADAERKFPGQIGVGEGAIELGDRRQHGGLALIHFAQHVLGLIEGFDEDDARAFEQRQQQPHCEHVAVKKRENDGVAVGFEGVEDDATTGDIVEEVGVGEHRTLGTARGAGGIDDDGQIRFQTRGWRMEGGGWRLDDGLFDLTHLQAGTRSDEGGGVRAEFFVGDQDVNAGVGEDVAHFIWLEKIINGDNGRGGIEDAEEGGDEFGAVLEPEADAVAGLDAKPGHELVGDGVGLGLERGEGEFRFVPVKGGLGGALFDGTGECVG